MDNTNLNVALAEANHPSIDFLDDEILNLKPLLLLVLGLRLVHQLPRLTVPLRPKVNLGLPSGLFTCGTSCRRVSDVGDKVVVL